jgi:hypothetical protein
MGKRISKLVHPRFVALKEKKGKLLRFLNATLGIAELSFLSSFPPRPCYRGAYV